MVKKFCLIVVVLMMSALLLAPAGVAKEKLVVSTWGYGYDIFQETIEKPFEALYDVDVVYEFGNNSDRIAKLRLFRNAPRVDVIQLAHYYAQIMVDEGLFEPIDPGKLASWDELYDFAKAPTGEGYGPAYTVSRLGIVYRTDKVKEPITSWQDLWREDLRGHIALPELSTTQGPMMLAIIGKTFGSGLKDVDTAFAKIKELKPHIVKFYNRSSELINMFERGEVWAAPTLQLFLGGFLKTGLPIEWCDPEEGVVANFNTINIVKGTKKKDLAYKYVEFILNKHTQYENAVKLGDSPVNKEVKIDPEAAKTLTYGRDVIDKLVTLDWEFILKHRDSWLDRWNREIISM